MADSRAKSRTLSKSIWTAAAEKSKRYGARPTAFFVTRQGATEYKRVGTYTGGWANDSRQGFGSQTYADQSNYQGEWQGGVRHGQGTLFTKWKDGALHRVYEGSWVQGKRHGIGKEYLESGESYEGAFEADMRCGEGSMRYTDGSCYEGERRGGRRHGFGSLRLPNGDAYHGYWADDAKHGAGKYIYASRRMVYVGEWVAGTAKCGEMRALAEREEEGAPAEEAAAAAAVAPSPAIAERRPLPELYLADPAAVLSHAAAAAAVGVAASHSHSHSDADADAEGDHHHHSGHYDSHQHQHQHQQQQQQLSDEEVEQLHAAYLAGDDGSGGGGGGLLPATEGALAKVLAALGVEAPAQDVTALLATLIARQAATAGVAETEVAVIDFEVFASCMADMRV